MCDWFFDLFGFVFFDFDLCFLVCELFVGNWYLILVIVDCEVFY